jgi:hypothetical protein
MELVNLQGNQATVSCELFRQYFGDRFSSSWFGFRSCQGNQKRAIKNIQFLSLVFLVTIKLFSI